MGSHRPVLISGFATICGVAAAVTLALTMSGPTSSAPAAFAFQRVSKTTVAVRIVDSSISADEMTAQLQKQGVNVTIDAVPVSPQVVGTWVSASFSADVPAAVRDAVIAQVPNGYAGTVDLPTSFHGDIRFGVGRAPTAAEEPQVIAQRNALAPGGRLGCLHATDGDPQAVAQSVEALGYVPVWTDGDATDLVGVVVPTPQQRVVAAFIPDAMPAHVQLAVASPGSRGYEPRSRQGYAPSQWETRDHNPATCTHA